MEKTKLSIIVPVYNEKSTIREIIDQVKLVDLSGVEKEIIVVDDASTDGTRGILEKLNGVKCVLKKQNEGKGAALKDGFLMATGDIVIVQDADLEYDPNDYKKILQPILEGRADVVYGSRLMTSSPRRVLYFWSTSGNVLLTWFSNMLSGLSLTDMETCYKAFRKEVLDSFKNKLEARRFGIEPELTARIAKQKKKWRIFEVGISYYGRTYEEGKKINWRDGIAAIWFIIKFNLLK